MYSNYCSCSVPFIPEMKKADFITENEGINSFKLPEVYYDGYSDTSDESMFDCNVDSVLIKRDKHFAEFAEISCFNVLVKDENGDSNWLDGVAAKILGVPANQVIEVREEKEYRVVAYDIEKNLKRVYKVMPVETLEIDGLDYHKFMNTSLSE